MSQFLNTLPSPLVGLFVQIGFCFSTENLSNHDLVWNIVVTIFSFFGIFVHGFLIRAYYEMKKLEKKRGCLSRIVICMRPWILYSAAVLIIMIIYNLVTFPYFWVDQDEFKPVSIWVWVIKCLGIIVLIGIWMVIYTIHKKNLRKEAENIEKKTPGV